MLVPMDGAVASREVVVGAGEPRLEGTLARPEGARGLVVFAHGSGSSRLSPRNRAVAAALRAAGFATLLFDLLTPAEARDRAGVFDIARLARRVAGAVLWARAEPEMRGLPLGLFGASTGAAAALVAAAELPDEVAAVVSRSGRPDLAGPALARVRAPVLLVVGGADHGVHALNRNAAEALAGAVEMRVVAGAGHLFEEPGALDAVIRHAAGWFAAHLPGARAVS